MAARPGVDREKGTSHARGEQRQWRRRQRQWGRGGGRPDGPAGPGTPGPGAAPAGAAAASPPPPPPPRRDWKVLEGMATVTERRLLANRRNAARSTGPRTARGKARSSRNALKH